MMREKQRIAWELGEVEREWKRVMDDADTSRRTVLKVYKLKRNLNSHCWLQDAPSTLGTIQESSSEHEDADGNDDESGLRDVLFVNYDADENVIYLGKL